MTDEYKAILYEQYNRLVESHKTFAKEWAKKGDYSMALRCSIIAEVYERVARDFQV